MSLTLDSLVVLDAIDRKGSFAAAAEELYRVPSAVSYTVQKLEQEMSIQIFDRSGHRARLTPAGKVLLDEGRRLLNNAHNLESHVKRIATGWEVELRIAVDTILSIPALFPLTSAFYLENEATRLSIREEVLGGTWDALAGDRADLIIGASGESPPGGGYRSMKLGEVEMVFAVAPQHPLVKEPEPVASNKILQYRAVAIADTSRQLPPRSANLLSGQEVLTVANMSSKLEAQCQGLGVGYVPLHMADDAIRNGRLITKKTEGAAETIQLQVCWRSDYEGKALHWFVNRLKQPGMIKTLLAQDAAA